MILIGSLRNSCTEICNDCPRAITAYQFIDLGDRECVVIVVFTNVFIHRHVIAPVCCCCTRMCYGVALLNSAPPYTYVFFHTLMSSRRCLHKSAPISFTILFFNSVYVCHRLHVCLTCALLAQSFILYMNG